MPRIAVGAALLLSGCGAATHTVSVNSPPPGSPTKTVVERTTVPAQASPPGAGAAIAAPSGPERRPGGPQPARAPRPQAKHHPGHGRGHGQDKLESRGGEGGD